MDASESHELLRTLAQLAAWMEASTQQFGPILARLDATIARQDAILARLDATLVRLTQHQAYFEALAQRRRPDRPTPEA